MDAVNILFEENLMSMKLLLKQYEKELYDLENGIGLAKVMSKAEINSAKINLKEHIKNLEEDINCY